MKALLVFLTLLLYGCTTTNISNNRSEGLRNANRYAVADCFWFQEQLRLKRITDGWGPAIVHRGHLNLDQLLEISNAVRKEINKGEAVKNQGKMSALLYCGEIIHTPAVRTVIDTVLTAQRSH